MNIHCQMITKLTIYIRRESRKDNLTQTKTVTDLLLSFLNSYCLHYSLLANSFLNLNLETSLNRALECIINYIVS